MLRICTVAMVALLGLPAMGQYGQVENGRAGDASLRVGSWGRNLPRTSQLRGLGNEIMTGNITRGRQFRGDSPISSTTDFGGELGSTQLDAFRRDSVGVSDIGSGYRSYLARPFYSDTRTVTSTGGLSVGFRRLGGQDLPRSYISLPGDALDPLSRQSGPLSRQIRVLPQSDRPDPTPSDQLLSLDSAYSEPLTRSGLFGVAPDPATTASPLRTGLELDTPGGEFRAASRVRSQFEAPSQSATLGTPAEPERPKSSVTAGSALDRLLNRESYQTPSLAPPLGWTEPTPERADALGKSSASYTRDAGAPPETPASHVRDHGAVRETPASYTRDYGTPGVGRWSEYGRTEDERRASRTVDQGDVYRMMMGAASMIEDLVPTDQSRTPALGAPDQPDQDQAVPSESTEQEPPSYANIPKQHQDELRAMLAKPVVTFTGTTKTMANAAFKEAEARLAAGKYYDAVTAYNVARDADAGNALVWIGRGHALIGAGDYLSASASLEEGLSRFPQFARFRVDLRAFLSYGDILDIRRADLERRLEQKEDYRLRFLLGYIEYYSGLEKFGLPNLKRAAKDAPATSSIAKFPAMLGK